MTEIIGIVEQAAEFIGDQVVEPLVDNLYSIRHAVAGSEDEPCINEDGITVNSVVEAILLLTKQARRIADGIDRLADIAEKTQ